MEGDRMIRRLLGLRRIAVHTACRTQRGWLQCGSYSYVHFHLYVTHLHIAMKIWAIRAVGGFKPVVH